MHQVKCLNVLTAAVCALVMTHAVAQGGGSAVPGDMGQTAAPPFAGSMPAKARRAANRKLVKRIQQMLGRIRGLNSTRLVVTAVDGAVTLSGSVPDPSQIGLAEEAARKVDGVRSVENRIRVSALNY
ncbi:BON domain-containing protein [Paraburkholderia sediminicola]|uniref:BON domain-containing protein n=1 Tax=Paraburkholderia sediminicola TaxID=458836 RepID=UPI0038BDB1D4